MVYFDFLLLNRLINLTLLHLKLDQIEWDDAYTGILVERRRNNNKKEKLVLTLFRIPNIQLTLTGKQEPVSRYAWIESVNYGCCTKQQSTFTVAYEDFQSASNMKNWDLHHYHLSQLDTKNIK